jgi:hypothetical protein
LIVGFKQHHQSLTRKYRQRRLFVDNVLIDLWQCQMVDKNETSNLRQCQLFVNKMIVVLFQIKRDESSATFKLVVASVSKNYSSSFDDKSSATLKLVVASVTNKDSKGSTNDSPAKVPTIVTSIWHEVFENYLPCRPIMNVSNTTSISAISAMTAPLNLSYLTPTILLLPFEL